jgi:GNAT superfamily N-acetyltransferase
MAIFQKPAIDAKAMIGVRLCTAGDTDPAALHAFLERFFGTSKADFLCRHGEWWHGSSENRLVIETEGTIAAYCGVQPVRVLVDGAARDALWWIDLVVAPEFRGRGLQTLFDREVRERCDLLLGFPNELAARIHRKHGWGVREDLRAMLAPLRPLAVNAVRRSRGGLRAAAWAAAPWAVLWRRRLARYRPRDVRRVDEPDVERWAELARRGSLGWVTALRDETHLRHRYLDAPYRQELAFYESRSVICVTRRLQLSPSSPQGALQRKGRTEERLLDLFGGLDRREAVCDVLRWVVGEASRAGASQVTALAGHGEVAEWYRRCGFLLGVPARLCWSSSDPRVMEALARGRQHWGLGDSDNDDPV